MDCRLNRKLSSDDTCSPVSRNFLWGFPLHLRNAISSRPHLVKSASQKLARQNKSDETRRGGDLARRSNQLGQDLRRASGGKRLRRSWRRCRWKVRGWEKKP